MVLLDNLLTGGTNNPSELYVLPLLKYQRRLWLFRNPGAVMWID